MEKILASTEALDMGAKDGSNCKWPEEKTPFHQLTRHDNCTVIEHGEDQYLGNF